MNKFKTASRFSAVIVGTALLASVAGLAIAEENHGDQEVGLSVAISELSTPGVLAMSVDGTTATLAENGSTATVRQFTGTLPTVTVTDTRTAADIPEGASWYVLGSSTDFTRSVGADLIGAGHLGWAPTLIDGGEEGLVAEGDRVDTVMETGANGVGLVDQELLAMAFDSAAIAHEGQWSANAQLFLRIPATVKAGDYTAQLTLSLFE